MASAPTQGLVFPERRAGLLRLLPAALALPLLTGFVGCGGEDGRPPKESAFVARRQAAVRAELSPRSDIVAQLPFGAEVEVVDRRRSLTRIRSSSAEGWVRSAYLVPPPVKSEMDRLRRTASRQPSQGQMRAFESTNVHVRPERSSPTVYQLEADEPAELLTRRATEAPGGKRLEDWYLLRLAGGQAGWVLARRVYPALPLEVAQYAGGRRIVSYYLLDEVVDEASGESKATWLWTQTGGSGRPYDFDAFRVFRWSSARGAYHAAAFQHGLAGFLPVQVDLRHDGQKAPSFRLKVEREGVLVVEEYTLRGHRVRLVSQTPAPEAAPAPAPPPEPTLREATFKDRLRSWWVSWSR